MAEQFLTCLLNLSDVNLKRLAVELGIETNGSTKNEIIKSIALKFFESI